jgi:hypothetical protein
VKPSGGQPYRDAELGDTALPMPRVDLIRWRDRFVWLTFVAAMVPVWASHRIYGNRTIVLASAIFGMLTAIATGLLGWRLVRGARISPMFLLSIAVLPIAAGYLATWAGADGRSAAGRDPVMRSAQLLLLR